MKQAVFSFLILFVLCCITGCGVTNGHLNMPLAGNKGEAKANIFLGGDGASLQGSYCLDSHIVLIADAYTSAAPTEIWPSEWHSLGNFGGGYFEKFAKVCRFEVICGLGYGNIYSEGGFTSMNHPSQRINISTRGDIFHYFGQADFGIVNKISEFGFGIRVSGLNIRGNQSQTLTDSGKQINLSNRSLSGMPVFIEPCFMFALGSKSVKWHLSVSGNIDITTYLGDDISHHIFVTTGLTVNIFRKL